MAVWAWVLIIAALVVIVLVIAAAMRSRRTAGLRQRFGPEYDRTVQEREGRRRAAESDLRNRQKQRAKFTIAPLTEPARARYAEQWRDLQERFIDQPSSAVIEADALVRKVMADEGYPMHDFSAQADLVSVDHPRVVENYRIAHSVYERAQTQQASTEDMRTALVRYRSLFDELLSTDQDGGVREPSASARQGNEDVDQEGRR